MFTAKFLRRVAVALAIVLCASIGAPGANDGESPQPASAGMADAIVVESQMLVVGIPGSTVGVNISNSTPLAGIAVPLEIRPLTSGASIAQNIQFVMNPNGRIANSPLGYADEVDSLWPEAIRVLYRTCVICTVSCSGPVSNSYCVHDTTCVSPTTPYGLFFGSVSTGDPRIGELIELAPGADPGTSADASLQIVLNQIGTTPGMFEIDTACWMPANSILFVDADGSATVPSFTKGVIELRCDCPCHADPECDGLTNIQDVVKTINVAFRAVQPDPYPFCPRVTTDVNCDGVTNILDVVAVVDVTFRAADPNTIFCDACAL